MINNIQFYQIILNILFWEVESSMFLIILTVQQLLMGGQFQPCKDASNIDNDHIKLAHNPFKHPPSKFNKLCASTSCIPSPGPNDIYLQFMEQRRKVPSHSNRNSKGEEQSQRFTPKIRQSRVQLSGKRNKNTVDAGTIRRREALGRMLAEKLGLTPSNDANLSQEARENKQRLSEVVHKICINNQQHLIDIIDRMENSFRGSQARSQMSQNQGKLQKFLDSISKTELDFLDMLYHNDEELYRLGNGSRFNRNITQNIVDLKERMMQEKEFQGSPYLTYEKLKRKGLQMIRNQKVCFFVLAGGKSSRYLLSKNAERSSYPSSAPQSQRGSVKNVLDQVDSSAFTEGNKDFQPLWIPSERSMVQLIIHRFLALSELLDCHVTIYLGISPDKIANLKDLFQRIAIDQKRMTVYPFAQKVIGALDSQGGLVVEDSGQASLWSVGTGDLWNIMRGDKQLSFPSASQLIQEGFEYLQVLGTSNVLEKCFDCFSLGLMDEQNLDWTTKVVQSYSKRQSKSTRNLQSEMQSVQTKIFINNNDEIYVCDPQQMDNYPEQCRYTFMNSSLFKLEYLQRSLQSPQLENLWPRKKVHLTNNIAPFSKYRKVFSYEKDYTDIFRLTSLKKPLEYDNCTGLVNISRVEAQTKWKLILCDQADYYPLIYSKASHSDIAHASKALCDRHKAYLGIDDPNCTVEIDPYISLQGERLEQLRKEMSQQTMSEEDWIFIQKK